MKRPTVTIKSVKKVKDATGGFLYELEPTSFAGAWELPVGTKLAVVSTPDEHHP